MVDARRFHQGEARHGFHRLARIANEDPDVALCNQTAQEGAMMFDRMERRARSDTPYLSC
jgi:hypothetical protein